jgi:hypothetical protein
MNEQMTQEAIKKNEEKAKFRQMLAEIRKEDGEIAYQDREFNRRYRYATTTNRSRSTQRSRSFKERMDGNNYNWNGNRGRNNY